MLKHSAHAIIGLDPTMTPPTSEYREIRLTQGQVTYVSPCVFEEVSATAWYALWFPNISNFYAARRLRDREGKVHTILMHRQILHLELGNPFQGDHVDRVRTLDNTTENLRFASRVQQGQHQGRRSDNTSGYKGVNFHKASGKWEARIRVERVRKSLGLYATPEEAFIVYCAAARLYHGEFACFE